jgi:hypothetical protein
MQKRHVELIDDLTGKTADETLTFGLDGRLYEIDLSASNAEKLRRVLAKFVLAGRRQTTVKATSRTPRVASDAAEIRAWAVANGYEVSSRGRVSAELREAYLAA